LRWSPDGRELYFVDQTGLVSAPVESGEACGDVRIPRRGLFAFGSASMLTPPSR
jgi:hypothetical protein